jgi:hypothetical protein
VGARHRRVTGTGLVAIELAEQGPAPRASIRALSVPIQEAMQRGGFENVVLT